MTLPDLTGRVFDLFRSGRDTSDIGRILRIPESAVYNIMALEKGVAESQRSTRPPKLLPYAGKGVR